MPKALDYLVYYFVKWFPYENFTETNIETDSLMKHSEEMQFQCVRGAYQIPTNREQHGNKDNYRSKLSTIR